MILTISPNSESTEAFETKTGLTKIRREERPASEGGKREREAKLKTRQIAIGYSLGSEKEKLPGIPDLRLCLGPHEERKAGFEQKPWNEKSRGNRTHRAVNLERKAVVLKLKKMKKRMIAR